MCFIRYPAKLSISLRDFKYYFLNFLKFPRNFSEIRNFTYFLHFTKQIQLFKYEKMKIKLIKAMPYLWTKLIHLSTLLLSNEQNFRSFGGKYALYFFDCFGDLWELFLKNHTKGKWVSLWKRPTIFEMHWNLLCNACTVHAHMPSALHPRTSGR